MSIFAYVFCVLLVATATTAADGEFNDLSLTTATLAEVKNDVEKHYEAAKKIVGKVFQQMKLEIPLEMDWPRIGKTPSATCFEFLKKGIEENYSLVASCSSPYLQGAETIASHLEELEMLMEPLKMSIDEPEDVTEFCDAWFYNIGVSIDRSAMCKLVVHGGVPAMIERTRVRINNIVRHVTDVANTWVIRAGFFCLVKSDVGYTRAAWSKACRKA